MRYDDRYPPDIKEHRIYHDRIVNGIQARPLKSDITLWAENSERITLVTAVSPNAQRRRADLIAQVAHHEMHYDLRAYHEYEPPDERNIHLFMYHVRNRIVGLAVLEKRSEIWKCNWRMFKTGHAEKLRDYRPIWSVGFIWVHQKHRRHGIARRLVNTVLKYFNIDRGSLGWYTPFTDDGEAVAKKLYPDVFLIAK